MRVFIVGVNGFIGSALARRICTDTDWTVVGIDPMRDRVERDLLGHDQFVFRQEDMTDDREWVDEQVAKADVLIPLAAIAIPKLYIEQPLRVFQLDFKENLRLVERAVESDTRLIFPSTSEVYGMSRAEEFREDHTKLVLGPVEKHRWIYSCGKQLLDRVIHAHGLEHDLRYTIFRPFNWVGPGLDRLEEEKVGHSRVVTQFIADLFYDRTISLVGGGLQRRCFLYLEDGLDALMAILRHPSRSNREIYNIGNPEADLSIRELAHQLIDLYEQHPRTERHPFTAGTEIVEPEEFYGEGYEDIPSRRPSIQKINETFGWKPDHGPEEILRKTLDWFLEDAKRPDRRMEEVTA